MPVHVRDDPASTAPAGCRALVVWGPPGELARWLESTPIEWVGRPQPIGAEVLVRAAVRRELAPANSKTLEYRRAVVAPWWRRREKVVLAGLAVGVVLGALGLAVWAVVTAVVAVATWIASNWPLIVAVAFVAGLAGLLLRKTTSGCQGLHCTGCRRHGGS